MLMIFAILLGRAARQDGITSSGFLWSAVIFAVAAAVALTVRYLRKRQS
jgi:hypothetical protein